MALHEHIHALENKHAELEDLIHAEITRPLPNFTLITKLKKRKLRLKEELTRCYKDTSLFGEEYA